MAAVPADHAVYLRVFASVSGADGLVDIDKLGKVLRCSGFALTQEELDGICNGRFAGKSNLSEKEYLEMLEQEGALKGGSTKKEILEALYGFGKLRGVDSDFISVDDLKKSLAIGKDPISTAEFAQILKDIDEKQVTRNGDGEIHIGSFVEKVLLIF